MALLLGAQQVKHSDYNELSAVKGYHTYKKLLTFSK